VNNIVVLIIASNEDVASVKIQKELLSLEKWDEVDTFYDNPVYINSSVKDLRIVTINDNKIYHENLDNDIEKNLKIKPKIAIFISRHRSKVGDPTLTVHPIGNFGNAQFGGKNKTLVKTSPRLMTQLLRNLNSNAVSEKTYHNVCFEVTHHGPYMSIPSLFIEVGSTKEEWIKQKPARIVAKSIMDLLDKYHYEEDLSKDIPAIIGIGGGHYAPRFTDVSLEKKVAFGHMIPKYHIEAGNMTDKMIDQAIEKTPNFKGIYIHRKSFRKSEVREFRKRFEEKKISVISSKELLNL
jgi:D-aminoacyl-tRNA deacylase